MNEVESKMISMIDFDSFFEAVKVTMAVKIPKDKEDTARKNAMKYLEAWAKAKSKIFVAFGESLSLKKEIDIPVDANMIYEQVKGLAKKYPAYSASILSFSRDEWADNCVGNHTENNSIHFAFPKICKNGAKPSKVLSKILDDAQFDIDLSKILQNRTVKGSIEISIHPMDFITMSTNTHKWGSCMCIVDGFNKIGGFSLMQDNVTTIAFLDKGVPAEYKTNFGAFSWNNKVFRQIIAIDFENKGFVFGHYNGTVSEDARKEWAKMLSVVVGCDSKIKNDGGYFERDGEFYYDTHYYAKCGKPNAGIHIGVKKLVCILCGKEFMDLHGYYGWLCCKEHRKR